MPSARTGVEPFTSEVAMPPELHLDLGQIDCQRLLVDQEGIRTANPQRFEMEQLNAICYIDTANHIVVGYKDVRPDEFWVRGHMPGHPLLPGVLMCEAAAQLCGYYTFKHGLLEGDFIGFAGMENVRFRSPVRVGDRLLLVGKAIKLHRRQTIFNVQGFVGATMVFHADILGVPMIHKKDG
jgi:3-hydroxyacyl-[acyl-carrier-protein] dehydratase